VGIYEVRASLDTKNILVTGGAGFIGTNFIRHALASRNGAYLMDMIKHEGS